MKIDILDFLGISDQICPMHVVIDAEGKILAAGPTLKKLRPETEWVGSSFFDIFDLSRPRWVQSTADLIKTAGSKFTSIFARRRRPG